MALVMALETRPLTRQETIRGLKTAWLEAGPNDAPILVFLHGFPDTAACWDKQIGVFSNNYRVIAPFLRGSDQSEAGAALDRYSPDAVALDVLAILSEIDPGHKQKVFCIGHDLGAVHAWHLAGLLQDRAGGVVILNGLTIRQMLARWKHPRQLAKSWYIYLMALPVIPELLVRAAPSRLRTLAYTLGGLPKDGRPADSGSPATDRGAMLRPLNQYRAFLRAVPRLAGRRRQRLDCPVLVLFGEDDAFLSPPTLDELSPDARRLTVRIIPGNHWLHRDQPERVNTLLGRFFADALGDRPS